MTNPGQGLPAKPNLDQLKKQARELFLAASADDPQAYARIKAHLREARDASELKLADAQHTLANEHDFANWAQLKRFVERVSMSKQDKVTAFVNAAISGKIDRANQLLEDTPEIASADLRCRLILGDVEFVYRLLEQHPEQATQKLGSKQHVDPLVYACFSCYLKARDSRSSRIVECAMHLLRAGATANDGMLHDPDNPDSNTPVLYGAAGLNNHPILVRTLLEAGAEVNDGESSYHAAEHNYRESLELLKEFGADFSKRHAPWNNTILYYLTGYADDDDAAADADQGIRWLLENGADPNVWSYEHQSTPLHRIAERRRGELVDWMIEFGADVDAKNASGQTPLHIALLWGNEKAEAALRKHGGTAELTPTDLFMAACARGDDASIDAALRENPNLVNELSPERLKALPDACWSGNDRAARSMLRAGFDVSVRGAMGGTPLHLAAWQGNVELVREILKHDPPLEVVCETFGTPPLGWATHGSVNCSRKDGDWLGCIKAIAEAGAPLDGPLNKWDESPMALGNDEAAALLIRLGATR